jgi:hypothetical protein
MVLEVAYWPVVALTVTTATAAPEETVPTAQITITAPMAAMIFKNFLRTINPHLPLLAHAEHDGHYPFMSEDRQVWDIHLTGVG